MNLSRKKYTTLNIHKLCVFFVLLYTFFSQIIGCYTNRTELLIWIGASLGIVMLFVSNRISKTKTNPLVVSALVGLLAIYCFHNAVSSYTSNELSTIGTFLFASSLIISLPQNSNWVEYAIKILFGFSFFHVLTTIVMFIIPAIGELMVPIWLKALGTYPTGAQFGLYNYRSGFTLHYSSNAIFCTVALLVCFATYLSVTSRRDKLKWFVFSLLSLFAIILTVKRGQLVFGLLACVITYIQANDKKRFRRWVVAILSFVIVFAVLYAISPTIPVLNDVFSRFMEMKGADAERSTSGRTIYWGICIVFFLKNPLLGVGWYGFRGLSEMVLFNRAASTVLDAHNVYLQLLCEIGLIGLTLYLILVIYMLLETISALKQTMILKESNLYNALLISFAIQVFYLTYSFTGNCFYDQTYYIYVIACAISLAIKNKLRAYSDF